MLKKLKENLQNPKPQEQSKTGQLQGWSAPLLATATLLTSIFLAVHSYTINSIGTITFTEFQSLQLCKLMDLICIYTIMCI